MGGCAEVLVRWPFDEDVLKTVLSKYRGQHFRELQNHCVVEGLLSEETSSAWPPLS